MTETAAPAPADSTDGGGDIVAPPSSWERKKWVIIALAALAWGWYSFYDGYIAYPRANEQAKKEARDQGKPEPEKLPHGGYDVPLNRIIGWALQPVGLFLLFWAFYRGRGEYRLSGTILHVPGHPPVPFDAIRAIDQTKWERKGIAYIEYEVEGKPGRLKLDDFIYEREPTDKIYDRILAAVAPDEAKANAAAPAEAETPRA
jgi:hypothetical protein